MFRKIINAPETETKEQLSKDRLLRLRNLDGHIIACTLQDGPAGSKIILSLSQTPLYYLQPAPVAAKEQTYQWFTANHTGQRQEELRGILPLHDAQLSRIFLVETDPRVFDSADDSIVSTSELVALLKPPSPRKHLLGWLLRKNRPN
ncbi:hypothetical protein NO2_0832 [Candidatus Termititenax persephonae]|uniref:Uncharacterized protein n=1 Tax=Candidatus Termititenax persephonae TaxID=2218525 RepID=A0A388THP6_9BACT|nr:hypothetical protein NO2_0832 [Candidatus Termititenax persephonae]